MSLPNLPYKTTFAAQIRAIEPSDSDIKEAKASISDLKSLLPAGIDPEADPQLLYIAANLYVGGMVNKNDDGIDIECSLATYKGFEKQQLNIEHDRKRIAGYILHAGLSEFGTDKIITEDEARAAGKPFNVSVVAVLWKVANRELCEFLSEASNPLHPDYKALSLSFEVGFSSYNIGIMDSEDRVISKAVRIVRPEDPDFESMNKRLRAYGGTGKMSPDSNEGVYQILSGNVLPLGGGIVSMPAAAVKGITAITQCPEHEEDMEDEEDEMETEESIKAAKAEMAKVTDLRERLTRLIGLFEKSSFSHTTCPKTRVSPITSPIITPSNMKSLKEIQEKVASAQKLEDYQQVVAGIMEIAQALEDASVKMSDELEAEKNRGKEIEKTRAEAQAANEELKKQFDSMKAELDTIKATQEAAKAEAEFNERMAKVDEVFELTDEDRGFIVEEIKDLSAEAFAKWLDKNMKSVRKEKTKGAKKNREEEKKKMMDEMCAALKSKGVEVKFDENALIKEVIASAKENIVSTPVPNNIDPEALKTLREQIAAEFTENMSIGGKKLSEYKKKE